MNKPIDPTSAAGLATLLRPRFSPGLLLEDEDLNAAVEYTRNMTRLLFRSLFGCGVICGLDVTASLTCNRTKVSVTIGKGVGLDCMGNPIEVVRPETVLFDSECKTLPPYLWVTVCHLEKQCRPRDVACASDDDRSVVYTRIADAYEIRVSYTAPPCACSCEPVKKAEADSKKGCCHEGGAAAPAEAGADAAEVVSENWCACYEDHDNGVCACDCDCSCIVIAKIPTAVEPLKAGEPPADVALTPIPGVPRFIRPVLVGRERCQKAAEKADGEGND